jgi:hypothetical protein
MRRGDKYLKTWMASTIGALITRAISSASDGDSLMTRRKIIKLTIHSISRIMRQREAGTK